MSLVQLIGGPLHGETVKIGATTRLIEVDLGDGTFASYSPSTEGYWHYDGVKCAPTPIPMIARRA